MTMVPEYNGWFLLYVAVTILEIANQEAFLHLRCKERRMATKTERGLGLCLFNVSFLSLVDKTLLSYTF